MLEVVREIAQEMFAGGTTNVDLSAESSNTTREFCQGRVCPRTLRGLDLRDSVRGELRTVLTQPKPELSPLPCRYQSGGEIPSE